MAGSWGPGQTVKAVGPALVEIGRLGPRKYRLLRRIGYCDPKTGQTWVFPQKLDEWTLDFSSAPVLVNWIIPVLGSHFNAFILHDALVEDAPYDPDAKGAQGTDYFGPKVSREEADRIARDAMGEQGTAFPRRWIAWVGMLVGTVFSREGMDAPSGRTRWVIQFVLYIGVLLAMGVYSTGEVLGLWNNLPWMVGEDWTTRLLYGAIGAIGTPLVLSLTWLRERWVFGLLSGLLLTSLLPAFIATGTATILYVQAERFLRSIGLTRSNACTLDPLAFGQRDQADQA